MKDQNGKRGSGGQRDAGSNENGRARLPLTPANGSYERLPFHRCGLCESYAWCLDEGFTNRRDRKTCHFFPDSFQIHRTIGALGLIRVESPPIVCLCGSTRFWREFQRQNLRLTLEGKIVLSIGAASGTDDEHFGNLSREEYNRVKEKLDKLHLRKIELADEVLILNVGGYIGESTARELVYARELDKTVTFLEPLRGGSGGVTSPDSPR